MTRLALAAALALVLGCGSAPRPGPVPSTWSPFDGKVGELNERLCAERGGRWVVEAEGERCRR